MDDLPLADEVYLAANAGVSLVQIAQHFRIAPEEVKRPLDEGSANARRRLTSAPLGPLPRHTWTAGERSQNARELLQRDDLVRVEAFEDDDEEMPDGWDWSPYAISVDHIAAHQFDDLVEATVTLAAAFPGVTGALRDDTEVIVLKGDFDPVGLETHVRHWWVQRLRREASAPDRP